MIGQAIGHQAPAAVGAAASVRSILAVRSCDSGIQGPENLILTLGAELRRRGVRLGVANLWDGDPPRVALHTEATRRGLPSAILRQRWGTDPAALPQLVNLIRRWRPSVLHTHDVKSGLLGLAAARLTGTRLIGFHYGRLAMVSSALKAGDAAVLALFRWFDGVLANSRLQRAEVLRSGARPERVGILPSFVETRTIAPPTPEQARLARERLGLSPEHVVLTTVGRLSQNKGHTYMLQALPPIRAAVPNAVYVISGDDQAVWRGEGGTRAQLERQAAELGIADAVRFLGYYADVTTVLHATDVVVSPSLAEGMQVSLLEAMAAARPIVATAIGGTPDAIDDGVTGRLVPPADPARLAAAVLELATDPELARRIGLAARQAVEQRFDVAVVADEVVRVSQEVCRRG